MAHIPADILISHDARQVMVRLDDGHYTALRGTARSFTIQDWLRAEGEDDLVPIKETTAECGKESCEYTNRRYSVTLVKKPQDEEALEEACQQKVDVLIAWWYLHAGYCSGPKRLIGRAELEAYGVHALRFHDQAVDVEHTLTSGQGHRIWQPVLTYDTQEEY